MKSRLKVLRAERDWTQEDLADRVGVSRQAINAIETEKYEPSLTLAFKLASLFGLRIEDVFFPQGLGTRDKGQGTRDGLISRNLTK